MKLSANTYCFKTETREEIFRLLSRLGYNGVEIIAHEPVWHADILDTNEVREASLKLLADLKLEVTALSPHTEFLLFDTDRRRQMVDHCIAAIDQTLLYGCKMARLFSGGEVPKGKTRRECIDEVLKGLVPCVEYAEKKGVQLAVESHGKFGNDLEALSTIMEEINSPMLGVTFDTANFDIYGVNPVEAVDVLKNRILHTHLKDYIPGPERHGTPIGDGSIDFTAILTRLKHYGYKGAYCVEYWGTVPEEEALARSFMYLNKLGDKLGL